jgi:hypothetical protein
VLKYCRISVFAAALVCVSGGVAAADPNQSVFTDDGYHFSASLTDVNINSVPNMAATAYTREAFVSAKAMEVIDASQILVNNFPVNGGKLDMAVQLGCQIDLSSGASIGVGTDQTISLTSVAGDFFSALPTISDFVPNLNINLLPGKITFVRIGRQEVPSDAAQKIHESGKLPLRITVHDAHIRVDQCGGPVSARVVAVAQMRTATAFDELNLYGDIVSI